MRRREEKVSTEIVAGKRYSPSDLDAIATQMLRDDAASELCRECGESGLPTGNTQTVVEPVKDGEGHPLVVDFAELVCTGGHTWYEGEGRRKSVNGENPILFDEHLQSRKRREIYTTGGVPDPGIVSGIYNRTHPKGRKVNSEEQRKKHGASFFR
jgi:hypothetical protein